MDDTLLCRLDELPDPGSRQVTLACGERLFDAFLVRCGGTVRGYINRCPHTGAPLDWVPGRFLSIDNAYIQCATHDALFGLQDGVCVAGPCTGDALTAIPLQLRQGEVFLQQARFCAEVASDVT